MTTSLGLDPKKIADLRKTADSITEKVRPLIKSNTTLTVERAVLRLMGLDGTDADGVPLPNVVVNHLRSILGGGIAIPVARGMLHHNLGINELAEKVSAGEISLLENTSVSRTRAEEFLTELVDEQLETIENNRKTREKMISDLGEGPKPWQYVIVATGNIYEDAIQAKAAAEKGADIIAVIRTTGQSLLDYIPYGITTEGFGGTYATQANFRHMRKALDEVSVKQGRYIRLVNYASGLCMPEIVVMGAFERLDMMLNDSMYGILFRDINPVRTFVDQYFSRMINAFSGMIINTGEDNYLTTADAIESAHTVLASDLINESFAKAAGLKPAQMGLGHAFEINPDTEDGFLMELAQALMLREIFPEAPLKYMPPTKFMSGDIFKGFIMNAMFNLAGVWSNQGIQLLGMLTEAMHTPFLHDRFLALENSRYIMNGARHIGDAVSINPDGIIAKRAHHVVDETVKFLHEVEFDGLLKSIAQGRFADISRTMDGGKGLAGVIEKNDDYSNPFALAMARKTGIGEEVTKWI
ncbi:lysine 5,6-aminomutase subunit alpha [Myxococcota bacterium]|nr:lysine 5,6-aminomutase subunit alpha [Myxococcota bacterium]MBU1381668.1 lysine 5,6-aminomutase subunit alpha [Myxococcota bacterium]MBU1496511.1 lysine 5,6-aminomutase subunit alpha [Myxococcota bacterium]